MSIQYKTLMFYVMDSWVVTKVEPFGYIFQPSHCEDNAKIETLIVTVSKKILTSDSSYLYAPDWKYHACEILLKLTASKSLRNV